MHIVERKEWSVFKRKEERDEVACYTWQRRDEQEDAIGQYYKFGLAYLSCHLLLTGWGRGTKP